jgi:hypothetical protein
MLRRVDLVRTDVPPKRQFLKKAIRRNIPEDGILHNHRLESLKSCTETIHFPKSSFPVFRISNDGQNPDPQ